MPTFLYSAAISGFCRAASVFDAMKELKQAGYDGVDLPLYFYARSKDSPLCRDDWWRIWTEAVGAYADELGLPVLQAHALWEQKIAADLHYESPSYLYARMFEVCRILHCKKLVFHPVEYPHRIASAEVSKEIHRYNLRWFRELLPLAERMDVTIELENTFDYFHLQMPSDPQTPYSTAAQVLALVQELNSPYVKLCLDTGHANIEKQDIPQMIGSFADRLDCLHLNDNFGKRIAEHEDLHLLPGDGTVPWEQTAHALKQTGYRGVINLELIASLAEQTSEERVATLRQGRERIRSMLEGV